MLFVAKLVEASGVNTQRESVRENARRYVRSTHTSGQR